MSEVVVISNSRTGMVVAVVEKPTSMSASAVAIAWAKANGFSKVPSDVTARQAFVTPFSSVLFNLIPCDEGERIRGGVYEE